MIVTLRSTQDEAKNIRTFFFEPERPFRYVAGQFIELTVPHGNPDKRGTKHWFTLSSAPGHQLVSITTKRAERSSSYKKALWSFKPGDDLEMSEPMGDFVLPKDSKQPLVFVAGGIGITPFRSIVQWLLDTRQTRQIQFLYSVHDKDEIIFRNTFSQPFIEVQQMIAQPNLTAGKVIELVKGIKGKQVFISGPEPMTEALVKQFEKLGLSQSQLITDYFPGYSEI